MQMFTMASVTPSFSFKEFCPLYYLLNAIPTKIQKGFRSILVYLTALDTNGDYIAVGSSIGMLYLYCRHLNQMKKYNFEGKNESITVVKLLSCFDDLVAVGTASGKIAVFQLVSSLPGRNKQLRRFNVSGFHKSSITALAWSPNGMKLFSGDDRGKIVYSALDLDKGLCTSNLVLEEACSIVQLDYSQKVLLVSTLQRSLLFYTEEKSVKQVGTQPRKNTGKFGACFIPGLCKQSDLTLFAGRPGIRLWKSDVHGTVQATFILKDVFAAGMKPFELYPRVEPLNKNSYNFPERQLGLISCFFQEGWVLSWNEYSIYLLDTINQAMIGSLEGSGDIVSVSCTENEIFLLKGDRDIIRISSRPEGLMSTDISSKLMTPSLDLSPKLQSPHSVIESMPSDPCQGTNQILSGSPSPQTPGDKNSSIGKSDLDVALVTEKNRSQSFDGLGDLSTDRRRRRGYSVASESRSRSSSVNSVDSSSSFLTGGDQTSSEIHREGQLPSQRFSLISSEDFNQELIVKPIKVKKKKKRRPENGIRRNPRSLESTPCYEYQGFSDCSPLLNVDSFSINSSLMGSITDRLSISSVDQESIFSTESQNVVREENGSETFSALQSPESVAALTPEDNGAAELLKLSNYESALGTLPTMDFSTSDSLSLLTEDKLACDDTEYHWIPPQSEQIKAISELPSQKEACAPLGEAHAPHGEHMLHMESTSDKLESLEETSSEKGMSANGQEILNAEDGPFGWVVGNNSEEKQQELLRDTVSSNNNSLPHVLSEKEMCPQECVLPQQNLTETFQAVSESHTGHKWVSDTHDVRTEKSVSSDEEDIYGHGLPYSSSETSVTEMRACLLPKDKILNRTSMEEGVLLKSDQFAESWMGYAGPGYGILSLVVSDKYIWCLDYKGGLYCSALPSAGLRWQRFEDNVQQVAVSPSGALLWKVEQKTNKAFACGKVTIKGKRHWYEALPQTAFVSLSDDTAWIIRTNGDLYLQTGLSVDRPCARAVKVDCPYPLSQVTARNNVVWALTEQRALLFREGVSSFCPEGEQWKCDIISEMQALEPVCVTLGDQQTIWVLDIHGNLWFRTGVASKKPQGDDNHWWQVSITDYVVFDQSSLFQTIIQATQTVATAAQAPVEKVADKLRMAFWSQPLQCQPSLLAVNSGGVWISSGKNEFHVAKGSLVGTYWNNVVPRGTASATKWAFVLASASPTKEGSFLWLCQSSKDLFCVSDQNPQFHPSTVQLPPDGEMVYYSACQDAIWCLDSLGQVFIRTLSPNCPSGMHWTKLDLSQLASLLTSLSFFPLPSLPQPEPATPAAVLSQAKTEEQIAAEEAWYETDKVWLVHKEGFSLASQLKADAAASGLLPEGKVKVKLDYDGAVLEVDEDDVEKANPPSCDRVEDLASLVYLNESSVLHTLRQRYGGNLIHTYAGPNMVVINPLSSPSMYSEKVMHMFKGCRKEDTSPHIYAVAQAAYRNMLMSRQDQSIILLGSSSSGKTTNCQHLVQYLATVAGSSGKVFSVEKWQALYTILEAFGNSGTTLNANATRFSQIISLDFDQAGQVASASVQTMLLEKLRVARRPTNEATFNVFYYLLACPDSTLRTELHFNHLAENNVFGIAPLSKPEEKQKAGQQFSKLQAAMKVMGISSEEQKAFWLVLGAIYHLGAAGATKDSDEAGRKQFARHEWAQKAAYLLGCTLEELSSSIFKHQSKGTLQRSTSFRQGPEEAALADGSGPKVSALECLEALVSGLYSELFTLLISLLNRALKSSQRSLCSMMIVDTPGFQNPEMAGQSRGATFEELCHNYAQERLQTLFHERTFVQELERYKEENIDLSLDALEPSTSGSVATVDQASHQALVRSLARTDEARGLLWLLEEESLQPGGNEDTLLDRLFTYYGPQDGDKKGHNPLLRSNKPRHFFLGHSYGTNWVEYDTTGWLSSVRQNPASQNALPLLQESQKKIISSLFAGRAGTTMVLSGSIAGLEGGSQLALRRATSMRKTFTTGVAAVKKKSLCFQIKLQVDALIDTLKKSKLHFVHCFLPKADGWSGGDSRGPYARRVSTSELDLHGEHCEAGLMQLDVPLLRAQIRGSRLLDALRMYRQGYPDHMVFAEFRRRFDVLAPHLTKKHGRNYIVTDEKRAVEELLDSLELEKSSFHMGLSRVFFRAGTLAKLEEQRDKQMSRNITLFQAACRGFLARQQFKKRKIQDLAIRCVQKNIKKNKGVKDWPWWKLFTTVRPLIEVQLTEDQIRGKDEEIQQLKSRLEKVEKERNELRLNSDRLESKITELTSELTDERNTGESASQLLDAETSERLRAEKEMKDLQAKYDALKKQMDSMEMEVMEARLIRAAELNGEMDDDDSGGEWRLKYERAIREIDFTKKRLQQDFEDKLEVEQQSKRQLERRLTDLQADGEESQRALQTLKKKCQRLTAELQDTKLHLEGQQGRNHELEKKQRRFDSELSQAHEEAQREKLGREKLAREKDMLITEVFSLKQQIEEKDSSMASLTQKVETLEAELQDLSSQESKDEASLAKVRKQLRDLEAKAKDQEEELDEQAGTIQMLEQAKLRLEMEMERLRQTHSKEVESRDEEVEEIRQSCQKKLKQMEMQLEEEYEEKQKVLREKRDLEGRLAAVSDQVNQRDFETEKRLRKDLKRTKALLADAQVMLDHLKNNAPSKREIAQLKNQLEESEFTCAAAVKARKSMEVEIEDLHLQIDDLSKAKGALEEQLSRLQREKNEVQSRLEEDQEDMNELMKKHKAAVAQASRDLAQINDLQSQLEDANKEKQELQEKLQALQSQLEFVEQSMVDKSLVSRQEAKIRELETRLEFERTQVKRLENLATRLKENMEKLTEERDQRMAAENREKEQNKRLQRQLRDTKEEMAELAKKEAEASRKKHELEMDLESLEAANQSLQSDLKLAFKRIGDLQAAIEDEMESDDNEELINSDGDSDADSELEDRVDGVKSWLCKNKGSSKTVSEDGSLKSSRPGLNLSGKEAKEAEETRPASVMSSLSYRKRGNLKDSIGGKGDEETLFSTLSERPASPDRSFRKAKHNSVTGGLDEGGSVASWKKAGGEEMDGRSSVLSQSFSETGSHLQRGLEKRWSISAAEFDRSSVLSAPVSHGGASWCGGLEAREDDARSSLSFALSSPGSLRRSASRLDDLSPTYSRPSSRLSLGRSQLDDVASVALSDSRSLYSQHSLSRSLSVPPRPRTSASEEPRAEDPDIRPVGHRSYLDPDLEAAIHEVLNYKPVKFKRSSLDPDSEEDDRRSIRSSRSAALLETTEHPSNSLRRSASALDFSRPHSAKGKRRSNSSSSDSSSSSSSSSSPERQRKSSRKHSKKSKKKAKKKKKQQSGSSSDSSSGSTVSYRSNSSIKKGPKRALEGEDTGAPKEGPEAGKSNKQLKKEEKQRKKQVDSLMMKYLYRPESD